MVAAKGFSSGTEFVRLLLEHGADVHAQSKHGETALSLAQRRGHSHIVTLLREAGPPAPASSTIPDGPALLTAVKEGRVDDVRTLLDEGADVEAKTERGLTALGFAAARGHIEVVRLLLEQGADVEAKTEGGLTALMAAAALGHIEVVRLLLEQGADVNAETEGGKKTALSFAEQRGHTEVVNLLREHGAR
jgi:ankyrin repeat protein